MNKIYTVTINSLDCNGIVDNSATWTFTKQEDQQELLDYIDSGAISLEENYEVETDEYFANTIDKAKEEVFEFVNG